MEEPRFHETVSVARDAECTLLFSRWAHGNAPPGVRETATSKRSTCSGRSSGMGDLSRHSAQRSWGMFYVSRC